MKGLKKIVDLKMRLYQRHIQIHSSLSQVILILNNIHYFILSSEINVYQKWIKVIFSLQK